MMSIDLTGGLDPELEYALAEPPANPEMRDSATLWIMDQSGTLAFPRVTIDAVGSHWDRPFVQLNMTLADGRALRVWGKYPAHMPIDADGLATKLSAGPLAFRCIEPFRRWTMAFDGVAEATTSAAQMAGRVGGDPVALSFQFDAEMAAPPWLMGGMTAEAARLVRSSVEGALMGGLRYEQLCRVSGFVRVGTEEYSVNGTGMRVRRQGVRNMGAATGHCQHSALFASGRAFGAIAFALRPDGSPSFNEGFVIDAHGDKHAARVVTAPWMTRLVERAEPAPLVLETPLGRIRIEGETLMTTFDHNLFEMADVAVLQQGVARYVWDGEEAIGLIERCTLRSQIAGLGGAQSD